MPVRYSLRLGNNLGTTELPMSGSINGGVTSRQRLQSAPTYRRRQFDGAAAHIQSTTLIITRESDAHTAFCNARKFGSTMSVITQSTSTVSRLAFNVKRRTRQSKAVNDRHCRASHCQPRPSKWHLVGDTMSDEASMPAANVGKLRSTPTFYSIPTSQTSDLLICIPASSS